LQDGLIVFDEGQFLLDSRNWEKMPIQFRQLLQKGRHEGLDFEILTQNINQIDVSARRLVHEAVLISKWISIKKLNFAMFMSWDIEVYDLEKQKTHGLPSPIFLTKKDFEYYDTQALRDRFKVRPDPFSCVECGVEHMVR